MASVRAPRGAESSAPLSRLSSHSQCERRPRAYTPHDNPPQPRLDAGARSEPVLGSECGAAAQVMCSMLAARPAQQPTDSNTPSGPASKLPRATATHMQCSAGSERPSKATPFVPYYSTTLPNGPPLPPPLTRSKPLVCRAEAFDGLAQRIPALDASGGSPPSRLSRGSQDSPALATRSTLLAQLDSHLTAPVPSP
eukprot:scaffold4946_cov121-Isochrysis_galbana.AAC.1